MIRFALFALLLPALLHAETSLVSLEDRNLRMSCESEQSSITCTIRKRRLKVFNVFKLENPTRLVVDLSRMAKGRSKYASSKPDSGLSQIRTGWHPEKYRIVMDINAELAQYSWEKFGDVIRISFETEAVKPEGLLAQNGRQENSDIATNENRTAPMMVAKNSIAKKEIEEEKISPPKLAETLSEKPVVRAQLKPVEDSFNRELQPVQRGRYGEEPASEKPVPEPLVTPKQESPTSALALAVSPGGKKTTVHNERASTLTKTAPLHVVMKSSSSDILKPSIPQIDSTRLSPGIAIEAPKLAAALKVESETKTMASLSKFPTENPFDESETSIGKKQVPVSIAKEHTCDATTESCTSHRLTHITKDKDLAPVKTIQVATANTEEPPVGLKITEEIPERSEIREPTEITETDIRMDLLAALNPEIPESSLRKKAIPATTRLDSPVSEEAASAEMMPPNQTETVRARMNPTMIATEEKEMQQGQFLKGISFDFQEDKKTTTNPSIFIKLTEKPHFNLSKVGPRTYRLRIMKGKVANKYLLLPFFPPHTFPKVSYVQAEKEADRVALTIGVERGSRLMAISKADGIQIDVVE